MGVLLYFLRHGQTAYSLTGGYCGTSKNDPGLTPEGLEMAQAFAQAYCGLPWRGIYVSPLRRTLATAQPICDATGLKLSIRQELTEIVYGQWEGLHPQVVDQRFHDDYVRWLTDPAWNAPTGGERGVDIAQRTAQVLQEVERTYTEGCVLLVSHKATIRIMLCSLLGIDVGRYRDRFDMPVAALSVVELAANGPLIHAIANRSHLSERLRDLPST